MPSKPHPNFDEIKRAIQKLLKKGRRFSGVGYRCTEPRFADQIVSGLGSRLHGARWTPKDSFPTVYLCETVEAALQEYLARGRRIRLPDHKSLPMVMAGSRLRPQICWTRPTPKLRQLSIPSWQRTKSTGGPYRTGGKPCLRPLVEPFRKFVFRDSSHHPRLRQEAGTSSFSRKNSKRPKC